MYLAAPTPQVGALTVIATVCSAQRACKRQIAERTEPQTASLAIAR